MPEGLEAEIWRGAVAGTIGSCITGCCVDERVAPPGFADIVVGSSITDVRRAGKVVLVDTTRSTIGLHFGMTGRLIVDGRAPIERLEYASGRDDPSWNRLLLFTDRAGGGVPAIRMNDPRRFGHVSLDPDLARLGVDIFAVTAARLASPLSRRSIPIKAALLDQSVVAGLGNLCIDEVLWWSSIDPRRPAHDLARSDLAAVATAIRRRLPIMLRRGGSTTGCLDPDVRRSLGPCPRCGAELGRATVGGRTTVWCPRHQW